jgi:hypothetical protein
MAMRAFLRTLTLIGLILLARVFPLAAQQGYLKTKVDPGRAGVFIDGKYVGPAANFKIARKYPVAAGEHEVKLVDPRYEEITKKVTITAGKTTTLSETLHALPAAKPPFGKLRTSGFGKYDAVYINDHFYGHADEFSNPGQYLMLNPGTYAVKVVSVDGAVVHEEKITLEADKMTVLLAKKK